MQSCLTICQVILYNCTARISKASPHQHSRKFEPPLPLYIGLKVHTLFRSKKLVSELSQLGLSVSYDRILQHFLFASMEMKRISLSQSTTAWCVDFCSFRQPGPKLFSTTATDSFHGTGRSLFQFPTELNEGSPQAATNWSRLSTSMKLLDSYTTVPAVALKKESTKVPSTGLSISSIASGGHLKEAIRAENTWLQHASQLLSQSKVEKGDKIAWAAYHASQSGTISTCTTLTQLMPLFYEKSATAAMVKHGMTVQSEAVHFLNPGQIPVTVLDAPLCM
jgi:hypothetical protein